ncbi:low temperature requirement protein A [Microbulbifer agarilyticus]|uniref:low temperature requirement protein A n=1 Tax=Microbulbifer agarilyticus TaxID=260552 RepID=UPI001C95CF03|nr:low temperature requirement protein A [Microbulbifer agarilyticus]MBY6210703.1 low temperature requirement protein A [Microbulbifer agarilyticus]
MTESRSPKYLRPLLPRDKAEAHRAATQLELLFDLVFVIAISAAAHGLGHAIADGHWQEGVIKFLLVFWCVWWPWNLFTWFASSFDNDDVGYRITVMVLMLGALFIAASAPGFFEDRDLRYMFSGYMIMRLAFASLWLRVAWAKHEYRNTALIYAGGQVLMQAYWAWLVFIVPRDHDHFTLLFVVGIALEMLIPFLGEKAGTTQWHRHHIVERFGLLNIIVLGEVLLGSKEALSEAIHSGFWGDYLLVFSCGAVLAFCMWWLYFSVDGHLASEKLERVFVWAYGHFLIFAGGAAVGAGLVVAVEQLHGGHGVSQIATLTTSVAVSVYVLGLWFVRDQFATKDSRCWIMLLAVPFLLACGWLPYGIVWLTVVLVMCLVLRLRAHPEQGSGA